MSISYILFLSVFMPCALFDTCIRDTGVFYWKFQYMFFLLPCWCSDKDPRLFLKRSQTRLSATLKYFMCFLITTSTTAGWYCEIVHANLLSNSYPLNIYHLSTSCCITSAVKTELLNKLKTFNLIFSVLDNSV
jgi:hypothetical protein